MVVIKDVLSFPVSSRPTVASSVKAENVLETIMLHCYVCRLRHITSSKRSHMTSSFIFSVRYANASLSSAPWIPLNTGSLTFDYSVMF